MFNRIRAAWRAFWNSSAAVVPPAPLDGQIAKGREMRISQNALFEAERHNSPLFLPENTYARLEPMQGTLPAGMAMDSAAPNNDALISYAMSQYSHEGLGFLGFPYLAELSQRAEYRHVSSIWAEHCTRKWIKLVGDEAKVKKIEDELKRLDARALFQDAIEKECFFGRIHVFMDFGDWDKPDELDKLLAMAKGKVGTARPLKRIDVVEPMWAYPGAYSAQNPLAPDFYRPSSWYVSGRTVHASRMLTMVGRPMPNMLKPAYGFGGVSLTQICKPYVDNWLRTRQSVSDLIAAFSVMVLKTDMDQVLTGVRAAEAQLFNRVDLFNKTRDNRGTFVLDKNSEDFSNVSAPIAGLDKLQAQALEQIASVSGIPLVILLGITPSGLNASSDGEIRVFYDKIMAYNEKIVGPCLRTLLSVVQLSLFDEIDPEIGFEFESLWEMSDADKAAIRKSDAEADATYVNAGAVSPEEVRERLNDDEGGLYNGRLDGPAPELPEEDDEDSGSLAFTGDEWSEGDHPRDKDGKFGNSGSVHDLSGDEVAPHDASPAELRSAAKDYFDRHLRGAKIESDSLGHTVEFNTTGFKEARTWSAHPDKLRLFPAVPGVIEHGTLVKTESLNNPSAGETIKRYHTIEAPITLRGEKLIMQVIVREGRNGSYHYDHWALEHKKGPTASDAALPNPKSGARNKRGEAAEGDIISQADDINVYFRKC